MMRPAAPGDVAAIDAFLAGDVARTMFLRSNLAQHGLGPGAHPHSTAYWVWHQAGGIAGVLGLTRSGMVLAHGPDQPAFVPGAADQLSARSRDRMLTGFSGDAGLTGELISALGIEAGAFRLNHVEPLFHLSLDRLAPGDDRVRPARAQDATILAEWFRSYMAETGLATGDRSAGVAEADERVAAAIAGGPVRLLEREGRPVAMAGLNARAGDAVQVGGVFVPPLLRNRGLARAVTRALLVEARAKGARHAVLFANNLAAARAYLALGFEQVGHYRIAFLQPAEARA